MHSFTTTVRQPRRSALPRRLPLTLPDLTDLPLSQPSEFAVTGVHHGYRQCRVVEAGNLIEPRFTDVLEPLRPVRTAWLSWIEPGGFIVEHIDPGPFLERWQIPLSEAGTLFHEGEPVTHTLGEPFRVYHDRWHSVDNRNSTEPRVSLVVDRDVVLDPNRSPLRLREE